MGEVDANKRYDCFISFHGSQSLSSLGFSFPNSFSTVRDFVEFLERRLSQHETRSPSIFLDSGELTERIDEQILDAILQLRGGGVGLVLLTEDYFKSRYCMLELRSFLQLARVKSDPNRSSEAITLRVLSLEPGIDGQKGVDRILSIIKEINQQTSPSSFLDGLDGFVVHDVKNRTSPEHTAREISDLVWRYWNEDYTRPNLGDSKLESFADMQRFFVMHDKNKIGMALRVNYLHCTDVLDVIEQARLDGSISYSDVDMLIQACRRCQKSGDARLAVSAYKRKWCCNDWSWSIDTRGIFQSYLDEAARVVHVMQPRMPLPSARTLQVSGSETAET